MRVCRRCGIAKDLTEFYTRTRRTDKRRSCCKACEKTYTALRRKTHPEYELNWRKQNPDRVRAWAMKRLYGLTDQQFATMIVQQRRSCAICQRSFQRACYALRPRVDHDHKANHVRGILCNGCNLGIGQFGEDPDRLVQASEYLRKYIDSIRAKAA